MSFIRKSVKSKASASKFNFDEAETLSAARTITAVELSKYNGFAFDPGGTARDVTLPAEAAAKGALICVSNESDNTEILTIKNDAGTTIVTPTENEAAILWCDGTNWYGLVGATA